MTVYIVKMKQKWSGKIFKNVFKKKIDVFSKEYVCWIMALGSYIKIPVYLNKLKRMT